MDFLSGLYFLGRDFGFASTAFTIIYLSLKQLLPVSLIIYRYVFI